MSFYNNTKAIGKAIIALQKLRQGVFVNNQLQINSNRTILIDADDPSSNIQLNKEGICFNYDKKIRLPTGDTATAVNTVSSLPKISAKGIGGVVSSTAFDNVGSYHFTAEAEI